MILEIKAPYIVNNSKGYGRMAVPVLHTWRWEQIAISSDRKLLEKHAEGLPSELFYWKREYRIVGDTG